MLTGKQRSYLKKISHGINPIFQIGKNGITDNMISEIEDALEAREIVKIKVLPNSFLECNDTANQVAKLTKSEFVQSMGNKFIIYKESKENKKIELPK